MKDYIKIIEESKEEMLRVLSDLIAIPSVAGEPEDGHPFGREVHRAYEFMMKKAEADGFLTWNADNMGGHIDFKGESEETVAVVGHLDVVPAGDPAGWNTDPYKAEIIDGRLYGRGAVDDKGPLIAGYFALKALKEAGFEPKRTIRIILGLDEETNWEGMEYYMKRVKPPVAGFSPDAEFPVIHGEKGMISFNLTKKIDLSAKGGASLRSLRGGTVSNAVPDYAEAVIDPDGSGRESVISAKGVSAHASRPELGTNAISVLFDLISGKEFCQRDVNDIIAFYRDHIGFDIHGERMGVAFRDEPSGELSLNMGIAEIEGDTARFEIDVRYPVTCTLEQVVEGVHRVCDPYGWEISLNAGAEPLYRPADDPQVQTLMEIYRKYTGDHGAEPITMGGATYARAVPNTLAFGPVFPGDDDLCHQSNEYIEIESLMTAAKIFAEALYNLAK